MYARHAINTLSPNAAHISILRISTFLPRILHNCLPSTIVTFNDPNTNNPASCNMTWPSTSTPPSTTRYCSDSTYRFNFPGGTYKSIQDFQLELVHTIEDDRYIQGSFVSSFLCLSYFAA